MTAFTNMGIVMIRALALMGILLLAGLVPATAVAMLGLPDCIKATNDHPVVIAVHAAETQLLDTELFPSRRRP